MININTEQIIVKALEGIELTATQYLKIKQSYNTLAKLLKEDNVNVEVYLQGSMRLGTIIKPYSESRDLDYDVDIVALYPDEKNNVLPQNVRDYVGKILKGHGTYSNKITEKKRCWRLDYAEQNGLGYHVDILPAVPEDEEIINGIYTYSGFDLLTASSIAITHKEDINCIAEWGMSNPKGFAEWFEIINRDKYGALIEQRKEILYSTTKLFASAQEVPNALAKTPMQRVIQVLKRHRDVYFSGLKREGDKPISIIITTLVVEIVDSLNLQHLNFIELLSEVTNALVEADGLIENRYYSSYRINKYIYRNEEGWKILNPVNTGENFADAWNEDVNKPAAFFGWLKAIKRDIIDNFNKQNFHEILCDKLAISCDDRFDELKPTIVVGSNTSSKPWSKYGR